MDISNGEGLGVSLFVQGCDFHCKNCFNKETWDFSKGKPFTNTELIQILDYLNNPHMKRLTILGGEPLHEKNVSTVCKICEIVKIMYPDIKIWIYTGFTWEEASRVNGFIEENGKTIWSSPVIRRCFSSVDVLVDGRYMDELKDFNYKWAGSTNQRIIDVQESLSTFGEVVLYGKDNSYCKSN